ncbi:hypothetical protein HP062_04645 [Pseudomonas sp. B14-6]|jgi:hypothetical protein|uniref:hypothetical protein n=1 Tax=Pseudomonas sp. B14-6 TaxID=2738843 RepID=UPI00155E10F5|nr:hypothetical protein [Pseudomonas sp. B14-6]QKG64942.1 hypothetical protein HP062_04645 [Pseudomonas sp. B14-6]
MAWFTDDRSEREKNREKAFIKAVNNLKTLAVTADGGMSIDPIEIQDKVIAARLGLRHFVTLKRDK